MQKVCVYVCVLVWGVCLTDFLTLMCVRKEMIYGLNYVGRVRLCAHTDVRVSKKLFIYKKYQKLIGVCVCVCVCQPVLMCWRQEVM